MVVPPWVTTIFWANASVGNFTASAILFLFGGRWAWKKHKAHLDKHHEAMKAHLTAEVERVHRDAQS